MITILKVFDKKIHWVNMKLFYVEDSLGIFFPA
jgi:hypothetical protein